MADGHKNLDDNRDYVGADLHHGRPQPHNKASSGHSIMYNSVNEPLANDENIPLYSMQQSLCQDTSGQISKVGLRFQEKDAKSIRADDVEGGIETQEVVAR